MKQAYIKQLQGINDQLEALAEAPRTNINVRMRAHYYGIMIRHGFDRKIAASVAGSVIIALPEDPEVEVATTVCITNYVKTSREIAKAIIGLNDPMADPTAIQMEVIDIAAAEILKGTLFKL